MRLRFTVLVVLFVTLFLIAGSILAQEESTCELDATEIVTVIESVCSATGNNELCYGNNDVSVTARENAPDISFSSPGDVMSINYVQSLYLSALNELEDLWGVAQMRLVTTTTQGPQEVTLLLYGDVEVDNAVEPSMTLPVSTTASINIRSIPQLNGAVIASVAGDTELEAVGRLEDSSWVRVLVPETEAVGWLSGNFVETLDGEIEDLDVMLPNDTYFGPMQAFYINTGTNLSCDNVATDGLIIQTPEGTARVTILINEVSIELVSPANGTATAVVQANTIDGMTVNVVSGTAVVSTGGSSYHVSAGLSTSIGMTADLTPSGSVTVPVMVNNTALLDIPVLEVVIPETINSTVITDAGGTDVSNGTGVDNNVNNTDTNANGNANSNANGNGNANGSGNANGTGNANGSGQGSGNGNGNANGNSGK